MLLSLLPLLACRYDGPTYVTYCPPDSADSAALADSARGDDSAAPGPIDSSPGDTGADSGEPASDSAQLDPDTASTDTASTDTASTDTGAPAAECAPPFTCLDLSGVVNTDHSNSPWTDDPSESFDVAPGVTAWVVADASTVPFVIVDPATNGGLSMIATKGGEDWRPSYVFQEHFEIDGAGASGTRIHLAGLASGWSDPTYFTGVAATLTISFTDGTIQVIELANGTNLDDWNHTWHSVSSPDAVRVYEDTTYGRHIDALSVDLNSSSGITRLDLEDSAAVHTGTAEKTSVALFSITVES